MLILSFEKKIWDCGKLIVIESFITKYAFQMFILLQKYIDLRVFIDNLQIVIKYDSLIVIPVGKNGDDDDDDDDVLLMMMLMSLIHTW